MLKFFKRLLELNVDLPVIYGVFRVKVYVALFETIVVVVLVIVVAVFSDFS